MIEKSFPEVSLLIRVLGATREYIAGGIGETLIAVLRHLQAALGATVDDLNAALTVLCREGLLARLTTGGGAGDYGDVMIGDGWCEDEAATIRDYPLRKEGSMAKLEAMKIYAAASSDQRRQFLDEYFRR